MFSFLATVIGAVVAFDFMASASARGRAMAVVFEDAQGRA